jgi:hypothetical protein
MDVAARIHALWQSMARGNVSVIPEYIIARLLRESVAGCLLYRYEAARPKKNWPRMLVLVVTRSTRSRATRVVESYTIGIGRAPHDLVRPDAVWRELHPWAHSATVPTVPTAGLWIGLERWAKPLDRRADRVILTPDEATEYLDAVRPTHSRRA